MNLSSSLYMHSDTFTSSSDCKAAHGRVGNPQFEQTRNTIQSSNLATIAVNFPLQSNQKNTISKIVGVNKILQ